jgi:glycosyltransferase involved in cell wall biosynthesis
MSQAFSISAIIPTHNRSTILRRTLESLTLVDVPPGCEFEVIVVGNRCTDDTQIVVAQFQQQEVLRVHFLDEPQLGANFARNTGFRKAAYDVVALLDDDLWVDSGWYRAIKSVYDTTDAAIVGGPAELWWEVVQRPEWFSHDMEWILSGVDLGSEIKEVPEGLGLIGCNLTVRREVFNRIGLFHIGIDRRGGSLMGGFESDFMQKAAQAGYRCFYAPKAHVKHWVAPHRITEQYMKGICQGYGEARIYIKKTFKLKEATRAIVGHLVLLLVHGTKRFVTTDESKKRRHLLSFAIGCGGLRGAMKRSVGRSPKASDADDS